MKKIIIVMAIVAGLVEAAGLCGPGSSTAMERTPDPLPWPADLPVYDHVLIVIEENKDYEQIIGNPAAPYFNNTLHREGGTFTQMFGEERYSQGNYFWLFSGSNQTVGFRDVVPDRKFNTPNLGKSLLDKGLSFKGYSEDLPEIGSEVIKTRRGAVTIYGRKHVPWISFANVPNGRTVETSCNLRFADFPSDPANYGTLPTVAFVIPNLEHDMHNGRPQTSIPAGDSWLKEHIDPYYQWARTHNSLLIVTFDENDDKGQYVGLTNPFVAPTDEFRRDLRNRTCTFFAGAHIKPGEYPEGKGITHVNILRTLEAMYGLPRAGAQQPNAAGGGIRDDYLITDVFERRQR